jgi:hypothetical protein
MKAALACIFCLLV